MVDCFIVLMVARTGDSLQGIKRGVLELAEVIAVNKADGDHVLEAQRAARELADALHLLDPPGSDWHPPVLTCSARTGDGIDHLWGEVQRHRTINERNGELERRRRRKQHDWMWAMVNNRILNRPLRPLVASTLAQLKPSLDEGTITAAYAADRLLDAFDQRAPAHAGP